MAAGAPVLRAEVQQGARPGVERLRDRIIGVDVGRYLAVVAVVFVHTTSHNRFSDAAEMASRFAVPFFFVTAGFFLSRQRGPLVLELGRTFKRLMIPFLFWLAVYLVWARPDLRELLQPKPLLRMLLTGTPAFHLWFLPSLALSSAMLLVALRLRASDAKLVCAAVVLYALALVFGPYLGALTSGGQFWWNTRNGPFFGFPLMVAGCLIARHRLVSPPSIALLLFLGGGALQAVEIGLLDQTGYTFFHDVLLGTAPFGIGAFLLAREIPVNFVTRRLARLGRYSLGIFCVGLPITQALGLLSARGYFIGLPAPGAQFATVLLVTVISTVLCVLAGRVGWLRQMVR
jgi:surface polysaccharide O-acyltransferase-like enzyme